MDERDNKKVHVISFGIYVYCTHFYCFHVELGLMSKLDTIVSSQFRQIIITLVTNEIHVILIVYTENHECIPSIINSNLKTDSNTDKCNLYCVCIA